MGILETWTLTISPVAVVKDVDITKLEVTHTENGVTKTTTITATGGSLNADVDTSISILVYFKNVGNVAATVMPWITIYRPDGMVYFDQGPAAPTSVDVGVEASALLPSFTMPSLQLSAEIRLYDWEQYWAAAVVRPAAIDLTTLMNLMLTMMVLTMMMTTIGKVMERVRI